MAEKRTIELEVKDKGLDQVTGKTQTLKQELKQIQADMASGKLTGQEFETASKRAGMLKDKIADAGARVKALSSDTQKLDAALSLGSGIAGGFAVAQGAMGAFGAESENAQKAIMKVQSSLAILNGVQAVAKTFNKDSALMIQVQTKLYPQLTAAQTAFTTATAATTAGMKLLKMALIGTGIGALVVGIGLLVANFDAVKNAVMGLYEKFTNLGGVAKTVISVLFPFVGIFHGIVKALEYFGVVDDKTTKTMKANADARTKAIVKEQDKIADLAKKKQKGDDDKYTHEINLAKAAGKDVYEMELQKAKAHLNTGRIFLKTQNDKIKAYREEIKMLIATGDANSDKVKELKKSLVESNKLAIESSNDNLATAKSIEVMEVQHATTLADNKKTAGNAANEKQKERHLKELENLKIKQGKEKELIEELRISKLSAEQKEIDAVELAYKTKLEVAKKMGDEGKEVVKDLEKNQGAEIKIIKDKYSKEAKEAQEKIDNDNIENQKKINQLILTEEERKLLAINETKTKNIKEIDALLATEKITAKQHAQALLNIEKESDDALLKIKSDSLKTYEELTRTDDEKARIALQEKNTQQLLILEDNLAKQLITQEQFEIAKKALIEKTTNDLKKLELDAALAVQEQKSAIQQKGLDVALQGVGLLKGVFEKSKGVQKAAVIAESAIGIAKMIISNKLANVAALATPQAIASSGVSAIPVIALNNISTGIGVAANIAATAKALGALGGGSAPTAPNNSSTPTASGGVQAPQFNVVGNNGMNQLAQLQQQPVQAYVVSSEMTSAQALERNRINNATI